MGIREPERKGRTLFQSLLLSGVMLLAVGCGSDHCEDLDGFARCVDDAAAYAETVCDSKGFESYSEAHCEYNRSLPAGTIKVCADYYCGEEQ